MQRSDLTGPFSTFLNAMDSIVATSRPESDTMDAVSDAMQLLLQDGSWLPETYKTANPERYQQLALYVDPQSRYSVVSFVWGPGQATPIHNHTVWGLVGVMDGEERCEEVSFAPDGTSATTHAHALRVGEIDRVSPTIGDVHRVSNPSTFSQALSLHVYGGDIGRIRRSVFDQSGNASPFISGYSNESAWVQP